MLSLLFVGFVGGIVFWGGFNTAMEATNTLEFCISCHEMRDTVYEEYKQTIHYSNRTGVRAVCSDCHVPKDWAHKMARKVKASGEIWGKLAGAHASSTPPPPRVVATPAALELVALLQAKHGPELMFHQSGGCCDNSAANCYLPGEITMGAGDVYLGDIGGCRFYIGKAQYETWKHTQLIIDVIDGHGGGTFSLEGPEGKAFHTRSRVFSPEELVALGIQPPVP